MNFLTIVKCFFLIFQFPKTIYTVQDNSTILLTYQRKYKFSQYIFGAQQCTYFNFSFKAIYAWHRASLVAKRLKRLPPMWETQVRFLGQEDSLEKEMATHSTILAWRIPWTEEPGRLQSTGSQRVRHDWATSLHFMHDVWGASQLV